jgi:hypothetical protein
LARIQPKALPENKFRAVLPDGATFELVGVNDVLENSWWSGDGSQRDRPPQMPRPSANGSRAQKPTDQLRRQFVIACHYDQGASVSGPTFMGQSQFGGVGSWGKTIAGKTDNVYILGVGTIPESRATVRIDYAAGQWLTAATCPVTGELVVSLSQGGVLFGSPVEQFGGTQIPVSIQTKLGAYRVVAIDRASAEHDAGTVQTTNSAEGLRLDTHMFTNLPLRSIKEFRLQLRAWQKVEFRNISLHRGQKTNFAIYLDDQRYPAEPAKSTKR